MRHLSEKALSRAFYFWWTTRSLRMPPEDKTDPENAFIAGARWREMAEMNPNFIATKKQLLDNKDDKAESA